MEPVIPNTLDFWRKHEESAPLLRFPLLIVFVQRFLEEAPKLTADFLSSFLRELDFLSRTISSGVSALVAGLSNHLAACLAELLWGNYSRLGI